MVWWEIFRDRTHWISSATVPSFTLPRFGTTNSICEDSEIYRLYASAEDRESGTLHEAFVTNNNT